MILGALISAAVGIVTSVISTVGPAIAGVAKTIISLGPTLGEVLKFTKAVCDIGKSVKALESTDDLEVLGAKALQPETRAKRPEETVEDYLNYLRYDVNLDASKRQQMSDEERMACAAVGSALGLAATSEKLGFKMSPELVNGTVMAGLATNQIIHVGHQLQKHEVNDEKFFDYLKGELTEDDIPEVGKAIREGLSEANADLTPKEIEIEVNKMCRSYNNLDD